MTMPSYGRARLVSLMSLFLLLLCTLVAVGGCRGKKRSHMTFAQYPGFKEFYGGQCGGDSKGELPTTAERALLEKFRPRVILPPGGNPLIDFYRNYLPCTVMRSFEGGGEVEKRVTPSMLRERKRRSDLYLDFQDKCFSERVEAGMVNPVAYGRLYRERVVFTDETGHLHSMNLIFLKYNFLFPVSGLPGRLPFGYERTLRLLGLEPDNWHELDNFVAIHVVLDEGGTPRAIILAQHNYHRTYLVGRDLILPTDGRMRFDVALRSNEIYPSSASEKPVQHRVVQWAIHMKYLLSGKNPPFYHGYDITVGENAGGVETGYELLFLPSCDPLYTSEMMLGEPRPFFGRYIGRDGPPGSDYYTIPPLLPLGNILKFSYLHDGDPGDIDMVEDAIDIDKRKIDIQRIMDYGGQRLYRDILEEMRK